jgi:hypothetical protein
MACTVERLIQIAEAEVGYLEKKSNSNLDSKTANAGYNNWTKYARDLNNAGYYNGNKNGYYWCDVFVDWLFLQLCDGNREKAEKIICQTGDYGAGCNWSASYYRNAGRFYTTPKVGDQIFFGKRGDESHTGIVYKVDSTKVYTIEGNTSTDVGVVPNGGGVVKKSYSLKYTKISGYGRPLYEEAPVKVETKKEANTVNIELNVLAIGSKGDQVRTLQRLLKALGYSISIDGDFGKQTDDAVRRYQNKKGLTQDGVVGAQTWNKLLKG